jgi:hypothetical protein
LPLVCKKKEKNMFEFLLQPYHMHMLRRELHLLMHFYNDGPGQVYVEGHNVSPGPIAHSICVQAYGDLLPPGEAATLSGLGPLTLRSVDDKGAVVIVKTTDAS